MKLKITYGGSNRQNKKQYEQLKQRFGEEIGLSYPNAMGSKRRCIWIYKFTDADIEWLRANKMSCKKEKSEEFTS